MNLDEYLAGLNEHYEGSDLTVEQIDDLLKEVYDEIDSETYDES